MPESGGFPATVDGVRQQFQEQIDFFRGKLNLPSETWRDIERSAHDRAFMVAGAAKADLLADLRAAVGKAVEGGTLQAFRQDFQAAVAKSGWTGWTGEDSPAGTAWRTRVIYQTNVATSYAAGRRAQLLDPDLVGVRPWWRYVHNDNVMDPRPNHKAWGDSRLTLRHDHPFWKTHFPPNGWGCQCRVVAVRAPEGSDTTEPPAGWNRDDPLTGTPVGVDEGWDYAPGARAEAELRELVQQKLIHHPAAIGRALSADVNRYINAQESAADYVRGVLENRQRTDPLWLGFVQDPTRLGEVAGVDVRGFTVLLPADAPRHVEASHGHDGNGQRPPTPADYGRLLEVLNRPDALRAGDPSDKGLARVVATRQFGGETVRAVFEVRPGKKNRALTLTTMAIKTATGEGT